MRVIKQNPALAVGVGMPILLVIVFALVSAIPTWTIPAPQYDVVLGLPSADYSNKADGDVRFEVKDGKLKAYYHLQGKEKCCSSSMQLFVYEVASGRAREVIIDKPALDNGGDAWKEIPVSEEVQKWHLNPNPTSPDGYSLGASDNTDGLWPFYSNYHQRSMLIKDGRRIAIDFPEKYPLYGERPKVIGWITPKDIK